MPPPAKMEEMLILGCPMKKLRGSIHEDDITLAEDIEIHLVENETSFLDIGEWYGHFVLPIQDNTETRIIGAKNCTLVLNDGRMGEIVIERVILECRERMVFDFMGRGKLIV